MIEVRVDSDTRHWTLYILRFDRWRWDCCVDRAIRHVWLGPLYFKLHGWRRL